MPDNSWRTPLFPNILRPNISHNIVISLWLLWMLSPGFQQCQTKFPQVTSLNVYLCNHPLSGCEGLCLWHVLLLEKWLNKELVKASCFRRPCFNSPLPCCKHMCYLCLLCLGGVRQSELALEGTEVWISSVLQRGDLWLALATLEMPVLLTARQPQPVYGSQAVMDRGPPSGVLCCCHTADPLLHTTS